MAKLIEYIGGDYHLSKKILKLVNMARNVKIFVEVFGGSGFISSVVPRNKFKVIVYNDKDELLYNFYKVLKEKPEELANEVEFIPHSRQIHKEIYEEYKENRLKNNSDIEKALKFFYLINTSFIGGISGWNTTIKGNKAICFHNKTKLIKEMNSIWKDITIENHDFRKIFEIYNGENTLFYCDPPFLTKKYDFYKLTFEEKDMKDLLNCLSNVKGKFILKLPIDHLEINFIREWAEGRNIVIVEHYNPAQKKIGEKRDVIKTIFIYNYGDKFKSLKDFEEVRK
jgi:DNA adenine methylase